MESRLKRLTPLAGAGPIGLSRPADRLLIIDATTRCNQRCAFCFERHRHFTQPDLSLDWVEKTARDAKTRGYTRVNFIGGEITLCRWLPEAIRSIRAQGLGAGIVTNGALLASERFARRLLDAGLDELEFSFLSHRAEDDLRLGGLPNGLKLRQRALENLARLRAERPGRLRLYVNIVLNAVNAGYLREMLDFLEPYRVDCFKLKALHMTSNVEDLALVPRFADFRDELEAALRELRRAGGAFSLDEIPLCQLAPQVWTAVCSKKGTAGVGFTYTGRSARARTAPFRLRETGACRNCRDCALRRHCCEPQRAYVELFGDAEFTPLRRPTPEDTPAPKPPARAPSRGLRARTTRIRRAG